MTFFEEQKAVRDLLTAKEKKNAKGVANNRRLV